MARTSEATRQGILEAAYRLFYSKGFAGFGMDALASAAGVTKRTVYYHFDSKDTLIAAMLEFQHDLALERIAKWAPMDAASPEQVVETLFVKMKDWVSSPRWRGSGFSRVAMELAALPGHPARAAARHHKLAVESALAEMLARSGATDPDLARQISILIEGALALALIHGDAGCVDQAARMAQDLVSRNGPEGGRTGE